MSVLVSKAVRAELDSPASRSNRLPAPSRCLQAKCESQACFADLLAHRDGKVAESAPRADT